MSWAAVVKRSLSFRRSRSSTVPLAPIVTAIAATLLAVIFHWDFLTSDANSVYGQGDTLRDYFPNYTLFSRALQEHGELLLWSHYSNLGKPIFAEGYRGFLHPLTLLIYTFLDIGSALRIHTVIGSVFGSVGMYFLARETHLGSFESVLCGVFFTLSGFLQSTYASPPLILAYAHIPFSFYFALRVLKGHGSGALVGLSVFVGLTAFAGYPVALFWELWGIVLLTISWSVAKHGVRIRYWSLKGLWMLLGGIILGLAIGAVQLIPTAELAGISRPMEQTVRDGYTFTGSLPPPNLSNLFLARSHEIFSRYALYGYAGQGIVILAILSGFLKERRLYSWYLFFAFLLLIAFGKYFPPISLWHEVPPNRFFRLPARIMMLANVPLALAATVTLRSLVKGVARNRYILQYGILTIGILYALIFSLPVLLPPITEFLSELHFLPLFSRLAVDATKLLEYQLDRPALLVIEARDVGIVPLLLLSCVVAIIVVGRRLVSFLLAACIVGLAIGQQISYRAPHRKASVTQVATTSECELAEWMRIRADSHRILVLPLRNRSVVGYHDSAGLCSVDADLNYLHGLVSAGFHHYTLAVGHYLGSLSGDLTEDLLRDMAVKFIVFDSLLIDDVPVGMRALQRTRCFRRNCIFEVADAEPILFLTSSEPGTTVDDYIIPQYNFDINRINVFVPGDAPRFLYFSQIQYPGWKVEIDGHRVDVRTAPGHFRNHLRIPEGNHDVSIIYSPFSLRIGAGVTLGALLVLIIIGRRATGQRSSQGLAGPDRDS